MKTDIKLLIFILTMVLLSQCEKDEANHKVKISDNNFLNALIELGIDTNGDGIINRSEAEAVISLDVSGKSISDMTGIEHFLHLESLACFNNDLTNLDISNNQVLTVLRLNDMPSLNEVCVWTIPFPPDDFDIVTTGSPNVYFTTDCTNGMNY